MIGNKSQKGEMMNKRSGDVSVSAIIRNDHGLYEGNLKHYFRVTYINARNTNNAFQNPWLLSFILRLCYSACVFYRSAMPPWKKRNLLIVGMFQNFNHSGKLEEPDRINVMRAVAALERHIMPEHNLALRMMKDDIQLTKHPYEAVTEKQRLPVQILRDIEAALVLEPDFVQPAVLVPSALRQVALLDVLAAQDYFLDGGNFTTAWARSIFPPAVVKAKIAEVRRLIELLA